MSNKQRKIILGVTGASGTLISRQILLDLQAAGVEISLIISEWAEQVSHHETGITWKEWLKNQPGSICQEEWKNMASKLASGSSESDGMIVAPCSMGTLGGIAAGISRNLIERAADVTLKEKRPLILVPREAPLNRIHLTNMLNLSDAGATILPPIPSFYHKPESIDDLLCQISARILKSLGIISDHLYSWRGEEPSEEP
ncbi:MAG: UbiX family flavin prenyltransferase [Spirochaetales bacterium]|nr:UbiX family flavin prenyltransferase [Spirochaetales bacterium]